MTATTNNNSRLYNNYNIRYEETTIRLVTAPAVMWARLLTKLNSGQATALPVAPPGDVHSSPGSKRRAGTTCNGAM